MGKRLQRMIAGVVIGTTAASLSVIDCTIVANASNYVYSSAGDRANEGLWSNDSDPGAVVSMNGGVFTNTIKIDSAYAVYASSDYSETLTLGIINSGFGKANDKARLQTCVYNQIAYIKSIGGVMTGYSYVFDINQPGREALNISWNIGSGEHHFARFELDTDGSSTVGYYDVLFTDDGSAQYLISAMNSSMYVKYGSAAVPSISNGWYIASTGDYNFYGVEIISISPSVVTFAVTEASGASVIVHDTDNITAAINNNTAEFNWADSWGVSGRGKMIFHDNYIELNMTAESRDISYYRGGSLEGSYNLYYKPGNPFDDFTERMSREMMSY